MTTQGASQLAQAIVYSVLDNNLINVIPANKIIFYKAMNVSTAAFLDTTSLKEYAINVLINALYVVELVVHLVQMDIGYIN